MAFSDTLHHHHRLCYYHLPSNGPCKYQYRISILTYVLMNVCYAYNITSLVNRCNLFNKKRCQMHVKNPILVEPKLNVVTQNISPLLESCSYYVLNAISRVLPSLATSSLIHSLFWTEILNFNPNSFILRYILFWNRILSRKIHLILFS